MYKTLAQTVKNAITKVHTYDLQHGSNGEVLVNVLPILDLRVLETKAAVAVIGLYIGYSLAGPVAAAGGAVLGAAFPFTTTTQTKSTCSIETIRKTPLSNTATALLNITKTQHFKTTELPEITSQSVKTYAAIGAISGLFFAWIPGTI